MTYIVKTIELPHALNINFAEQGDPSSIPLLLLHGFADSWHSFELVLPHLAGSIHTFALTQRGHGESSRPATGYSVEILAADLLDFMDKLNLEKAVVAGGSSGAFTARRFAIDHPERTLGLVLLGSPLSMRDKPGVLELWNSTISKLTDPIDPNFVRKFAESTFSQAISQEFMNKIIKENLKVPAHVWKSTLKGLLEDNTSSHLYKIKCPTLLIWGDKDTIVARSEQEAVVNAIANSQLIIYPGAGHILYCEEPARIASDISAFITRLLS
jgi:pimeloyl-ACP methyl ester carboxylesterase